MNATAEKSTHRFQAEVSQVLSLVINSLYSHRDIFLRELISNASDALDKLRFRAVTEPDLLPKEELKVRLIPDEKARTLTIWDNGIGMNAESLARELGTIAHSGTKTFLEKLEASKRSDLKLIGQFGVGFYSAYLVADRVEVVSRAAGESQAHRWESTGTETYTLEPAERECAGTTITLHLKPDANYLDRWSLQGLVRKYSDYLDYPVEFVETQPEQADEAGQAEPADPTKLKSERLNQGKALWQRRPSEVTEEQYNEFYQHLTHDYEPASAKKHFHVEGTQLFTGLLFLPKRAPFDLFSPESKHGVRLYVRRVLIMEHCEELLPRWLRFVRGVIDSEDLPLNVSRELLQDSGVVRTIKKQVTKQTLDLLAELAEKEPAKYAEFWAIFGKVLKEGLHFEPDQKDRLLPLLRYESSRGEGLVSLADYKKRMVEGQNAIYYVVAESRTLAENSPHIEGLRKRGYEVLFMTDPVDSFVVESLDKFEEVPFASAAGAELEIDKRTDAEKAEQELQIKDLKAKIRVVLQDQISEVRISNRLTDSPACLVIPDGGLSPYIERLLRATQKENAATKRILEINPEHAVIRNLERLAEKDPESAQLSEWIHLLFEQALLAEGSPIENPAKLAARLTGLLAEASARVTL